MVHRVRSVSRLPTTILSTFQRDFKLGLFERMKFGQKIGRLDNQDMARLGIALAFVLGLAD
jgi:hypothetical protein